MLFRSNGRILAVAMQDLIEQDQKLARFKMHQFQQINGVNEIIQTPFVEDCDRFHQCEQDIAPYQL